MRGIFGHCDNSDTMTLNARPNLAKDVARDVAIDLAVDLANPAADLSDQAMALTVRQAIKKAGGWIGFDEFMALALYAPGLGYYAHGSAKFGTLPADALQDSRKDGGGGEGSDFVTGPEMTPLFGQTLATQVAQALLATRTAEVWEFGAGSGALALQVLDELARLHVPLERYAIVDLSGSLRARQQKRLMPHADKVRWVDALPQHMHGVVLGNEVLDAMPVKLLVRAGGQWCERGVALTDDALLAWADTPTDLRPAVEVPGPHDYLTEIHPQAEAFIRTLADKLTQGAAFFLDYGFPEGEYYHPQRHMGTVMCHRQHRADANPLIDVGLKDITAHVNFTGIAMAGQDAGLDVLGYCTQARFLMNCGLLNRLETASFADKSMAQKLIMEHEMGELFKVIGFARGGFDDAIGFAQGDRTHTL